MRVCDFTGQPATDKIIFDRDGTTYDICESVRASMEQWLMKLKEEHGKLDAKLESLGAKPRGRPRKNSEP